MKTWQYLALGILLGLFAAGIILLVARQPQGYPIQIQPTPTQADITVYVDGAVGHPGLYTLSPASRAADAVTVAGGFTAQADTSSVNLAARLSDGQKVEILAIGQSAPTVGAISFQNPIDLNSATLEQFETIPGIGPAKAAAIIAYREQNGLFLAKEDIQNVPGIGPGIYSSIKDYIFVGSSNQ
ncbi:MAG: ComEA family DNA-binding protein [Anaerolineaceae bacterium]|jgi:competence protein ComEA